MEMLLYLVPVFGILGLLFAAYLAARVGRQDAGNDRMKEIAAAISDGAQAFLTAEYKILIIFVAVLFILIGVGIGNWITAVCFVVGALFSTLAGYCGMKVATKAKCKNCKCSKRKRNEQSTLNCILRWSCNGYVCSWFWCVWCQHDLHSD